MALYHLSESFPALLRLFVHILLIHMCPLLIHTRHIHTYYLYRIVSDDWSRLMAARVIHSLLCSDVHSTISLQVMNRLCIVLATVFLALYICAGLWCLCLTVATPRPSL